jgi:hypothetical protein
VEKCVSDFYKYGSPHYAAETVNDVGVSIQE